MQQRSTTKINLPKNSPASSANSLWLRSSQVIVWLALIASANTSASLFLNSFRDRFTTLSVLFSVMTSDIVTAPVLRKPFCAMSNSVM